MRFNQNKLLGTLLLALAQFASATTWYVNGISGNDNNDCRTRETACKTIGHAISLASSGDTIGVGPTTYAENLAVGKSLNIIGSGPARTIIDGGGDKIVVSIGVNIQVALSGLTIQNGAGFAEGGGISSYGSLTISKCTVRWNTVRTNVINGWALGAGIYIGAGTVLINDSTISGNTLHGVSTCEKGKCTGEPQGAGIYNSNTYTKQPSLTLNNSTVSENQAIAGASSGGAIAGSGSVSINSSTIANNSAESAGGIFGTAAMLQNSILSNNSGGNCSGTLGSNGYNLSSDDTCNFDGPGDLNDTEPSLGALGNYGGPTQTIPELVGSPTIDAGNPEGCTNGAGKLLTTDQRGYPRPGKDKQDKRCDMGAYEIQTD